MPGFLFLCAWVIGLTGSVCGADATSEQTKAVKLPPMVVGESRAEAFYIRFEEGEVTRLWFASLDGSSPEPKLASASGRSRPGTKTRGYLVAFRSFGVRSGDEIISINGKLVAGMVTREWTRALWSSSDEPPVTVEVRAPGAKVVRSVSVVPQNSVALGAKVPRVR